MARKSDGEKIDELMTVAAALTERVDSLREQLKELKAEIDESRRKLWLLVPPAVAAFLSAGLSALVTYLVSHR